jgi:two-component system, chemotaxis family, chemotaxis protein CheY
MADRKPRVLVIDDAGLQRLYCREILEGAGFEVAEALNGIEALESPSLESADLLIVDVNMPQMDGITFLAALRRMPPPLCSIPAMVTSTESGPQDLAAARAAGANFYLIKPVSADTMREYASLLCGTPR